MERDLPETRRGYVIIRGSKGLFCGECIANSQLLNCETLTNYLLPYKTPQFNLTTLNKRHTHGPTPQDLN